MLDQIQYKQWTSTDRSTFETKVQTVVSQNIIEKQNRQNQTETRTNNLCHDFIAKLQFQQNKK